MSTSTQRASRFLIEQDEADYAATAAHQRDVKAWPAESGAVLDPLDELRILESWLEDHEGAATNAGSLPTPRIANVTHFERPTIRGEVDAALAADEEVHVSDALTGEDLGAAIVNERWWTLKDPRALAHGQVVVYVARVLNEKGDASELSNPCEFIFVHPSAGRRAQGARGSADAMTREMFENTMPAGVALITQVTTQYQEKIGAPSRRRSGDAKNSRGYRRISGTLSEALRAGESVHVFDGSIDLGPASVNGKTWTFCDARILRLGTALSYTAHVTDRAGNLGPVSSIFMMTVGESSG